jgi:hypothetical protein
MQMQKKRQIDKKRKDNKNDSSAITGENISDYISCIKMLFFIELSDNERQEISFYHL